MSERSSTKLVMLWLFMSAISIAVVNAMRPDTDMVTSATIGALMGALEVLICVLVFRSVLALQRLRALKRFFAANFDSTDMQGMMDMLLQDAAFMVHASAMELNNCIKHNYSTQPQDLPEALTEELIKVKGKRARQCRKEFESMYDTIKLFLPLFPKARLKERNYRAYLPPGFLEEAKQTK